MSKQTLSVYGCGGAGANIVRSFIDLPDDPNKPLYPKVTLNHLDTSDSNMVTSKNKVNTFVIPGLEGAGKHRVKAYDGVETHITGILNDHKPGNFNIVVFSGSGGSGSVLGPLVTAELLRRNLPTVCIVVGSTTSSIETDNSNKTLRTLQSMASSGKTGGKPICMFYLENGGGNQRQDYMGSRVGNDLRIEEAIRQLALLFSGMHREMDRTDLANWLNWRHTSPDIPSQLVEILIFKDNGDTGIDAYRGAVIGTASILNEDDDPVPDLDQPYSCVGYITDTTRDFAEIPNHNYILTGVRVPLIFRNLDDRMATYRAAKLELMNAELAGMSSSEDNESGMIL